MQCHQRLETKIHPHLHKGKVSKCNEWQTNEPTPDQLLSDCQRHASIYIVYIHIPTYIYKKTGQLTGHSIAKKVYLANIWQRRCVFLFIRVFFSLLNVFELTFWHFGIANFDSVPGGGDVSSVSAFTVLARKLHMVTAEQARWWATAPSRKGAQSRGVEEPTELNRNHLHTTQPVGHFKVDPRLYNKDGSESSWTDGKASERKRILTFKKLGISPIHLV